MPSSESLGLEIVYEITSQLSFCCSRVILLLGMVNAHLRTPLSCINREFVAV